MALTLSEALSFVPKVIGTIEKAITTVGTVKALPVKNAKTVAGALGVADGSLLHDLVDLVDDVIAAAKD